MFLILKSYIHAFFSFEHNRSMVSIQSSELQLCLASHVFTVNIMSESDFKLHSIQSNTLQLAGFIHSLIL